MVDLNNVQWGDTPRDSARVEQANQRFRSIGFEARADHVPVVTVPPTVPPVTRAAHVAAICSGIAFVLGFLTGWAAFLAFVGAVIGTFSFRLIRRDGERGAGLALLGAIVGYIGIVVWGGNVGMVFVFFTSATMFVRLPERRPPRRSGRCRTREGGPWPRDSAAMAEVVAGLG